MTHRLGPFVWLLDWPVMFWVRVVNGGPGLSILFPRCRKLFSERIKVDRHILLTVPIAPYGLRLAWVPRNNDVH